MIQDVTPAWVIVWECVMAKDDKKPKPEKCDGLTPVEEAVAARSGPKGPNPPPPPPVE